MKINKILTNFPVSLNAEEVENLSLTLSAVRTAGGGSGPGKTYIGDNAYVLVDNTQNPGIITLRQETQEKINNIPTRVTDLADSADYQTVAGMDDYLTKTSASNNLAPLSVTADIETLKNASGNFSLYYKKTETSGISELNTAFESKQDNLTQEQLSAISSVSSIKGTILTGDSNILTTSAEVGNNIKWTLQLTAQPTVTDTTLSGYDGIVATKDSTVSSQWNVGIAQAYKEQIEEVSSKLIKTDADTYYAPISVTGDVDTLKSSSGDWNKVSAKLDTSAFSSVSGKFISASQPFTANLGEAGVLSVTNGATAVFTNNASFSSFANTLIQGIANSTILGDSFCQGTSNTADGVSLAQGSVNYAKNTSIAQGSVNSAINCSQAFGVGNVITDTGMAIGKYNKTSSDASFVIGNGTNSNRSDLFIIKHDGTVSSTGDFIVDGKSLSSVYNTVSTNSGDWLKESDLNNYVTTSDLETTSGKLLTTAQYQTDSATFLTAHQSLDNYYTKTQVDSTFASATQLNNYLTTAKYQTDSATFALKTEIPTTVAELTDSGNYYQKTETSGATELATEFAKYVTSSNVTTQDTDYVMTTTGWKVLTLPGGGMTQVIHDTTLTGQGNADDSKLGVAWSALSGNTINSALSAGSAASAEFAEKTWVPQGEGLPPYTANIGYNIKILHDFIDDIYLEPNWFPRETPIYADYALSAYIDENNVSSFNDFTNAINAKLDTTAAAQTYLTTATYATDSATFVTSSSNTITGTKQYALTTAGWSEVSTPTIPDITANNGLSANGHTIGIDNTNLVADTQYAWTTTGWDEVSTPTIPAITAESGISADGYKIGLTTTAINAISSVSSKLDTSALTVNTANNAITLATGPSTSASVSAVNYKANYSEPLVVPQRIVVALNDQDIIDHISYYSDSQYGTIIFVTSAHTY